MTIRITIIVDDIFEADTIEQVLGSAEQDGDIDFGFEYKKEEVDDDEDDSHPFFAA